MKLNVLYIDTEFERTRTFYAKPALIQVFDGQSAYLLDPLKLTSLASFATIWRSDVITKVLHAASEDIEVLSRLVGTPPTAIFDTQIAAALLGYGYSIGYASLTKTMTGVILPKHETRSNWLRRPLTQNQLKYAALDVAHLPAIYSKFSSKLTQTERHTWLHEECEKLAVKHGTEPHDFLNIYLKIGQAWRLNRKQLGVLRAICAWRENEARRRDRPRSQILADTKLFDIARAVPKDLTSLKQIEGISSLFLEKNGVVILKIVEKVGILDSTKLPKPLSPPVDMRMFTSLIKGLKQAVVETAKELQINQEILAHRNSIETLIRQQICCEGGLTEHFSGWRRKIIGERLLQILVKSNQVNRRCSQDIQ